MTIRRATFKSWRALPAHCLYLGRCKHGRKTPMATKRVSRIPPSVLDDSLLLLIDEFVHRRCLITCIKSRGDLRWKLSAKRLSLGSPHRRTHRRLVKRGYMKRRAHWRSTSRRSRTKAVCTRRCGADVTQDEGAYSRFLDNGTTGTNTRRE